MATYARRARRKREEVRYPTRAEVHAANPYDLETLAAIQDAASEAEAAVHRLSEVLRTPEGTAAYRSTKADLLLSEDVMDSIVPRTLAWLDDTCGGLDGVHLDASYILWDREIVGDVEED